MQDAAFKVLFCFIFVVNSCVKGATREENIKEYVGQVEQCLKSNSITQEALEEFKKLKIPDNDSTKCFIACVLKKSGMMDQDGMLSIEGSKKLNEKLTLNTPENIKKIEDFINICKKVNDEDVRDGSKGCDRAALIYKCIIEKVPELMIPS